jgi:GNAT superfamily N-acetyltransferase
MRSFSIRVATPEDTPVVAAMRRAWTEEYVGRKVEDDAFEQEFAEWSAREQRQRVTWLAEREGHPVGMLNMLVFTRMPRPVDPGAPGRPSQWGYIANAYVAADQRNAGIGAALVEAATQYADAHRFARLVLSPNDLAISLYQRAGFGPATGLMVRPGASGWY